MKYWNITFSPTGGTLKVADLLMHTLSQDQIYIDLTDPELDYTQIDIQADDVVLFAVPSYGGLVPETALHRLECIEGNNAKCILLTVYGNRAYEDTLIQLADTVKSDHFQVVAAIAAIAQHAIVKTIAADRPDIKDVTTLVEYAKKISQKLQNNDTTEPIIPGNRPYRTPSSFSLIPHVANKCRKCGKCADKCPVEAIDKDDPTSTDHNRCISCMRCINVCPTGARKVNNIKYAACKAMLETKASRRREPELFI